jgi:hypothetical protein
MAIFNAIINHFLDHQLDASEANLLHQNGTITFSSTSHPGTQQPNYISGKCYECNAACSVVFGVFHCKRNDNISIKKQRFCY